LGLSSRRDPNDYNATCKGYVIQLGGNGNYTENITTGRLLDFSGGSANTGVINGPNLTANQFNLLGNPYNNFLDLDLFLLSSNNKTKVKGPIMLWSHNTLLSDANVNPNDPNVYVNSANDFALYNVLGGVAAGREISTSDDVTGVTSTGIQTPNGKICFGTGFGVYSIGNGNIIYDDSMRTASNGGEIQSFRMSNENNNLDTKDLSNGVSGLPPSTRSRIWLNIERGVPPVSGPNFNPLKQILVGYSPCYGSDCATTADNDRVFDAETVNAASNPSIDFYSFAASSTRKLAIQGRGDFLNTDFFQLGYKVATAGTYTFTSSHDGMFNTKPYYILDATDGQYHTLPYTFTTAAGTFDNRFRVVFENLIGFVAPVNVCNSQLTSIWNVVYAQLISGVTSYNFEIRNLNGSLFGVFNGINATYYYVRNLNIPGIQYNTTYRLRVATYQVDNVWQYGPECLVISPPPPTAKLTDTVGSNPGSCGSTINNFTTSLYSNSPGELGFLTSGYRFQVSTTSNFATGTIVGEVERLTNSFSLAQLRPAYNPLPNTIYYVRVQIQYNNTGTATWQVDAGGNPVYGPVCTVTTTANATGRFSNSESSIFDVKAYPNPFSANFKLDVDTSSEEKVEMKVYDIIGREIESRIITASNLNTVEIGETYTSGVYNVIVKQGENLKTIRVVKR